MDRHGVAMSATGAATTAAYQATVMNAQRATGPVVHLDSHAFAALAARNREALVVHAPGSMFSPHKYLMGYKGLFFATKSRAALDLPRGIEVMVVRRLHLPY